LPTPSTVAAFATSTIVNINANVCIFYDQFFYYAIK
jgi:hypothetical protein